MAYPAHYPVHQAPGFPAHYPTVAYAPVYRLPAVMQYPSPRSPTPPRRDTAQERPPEVTPPSAAPEPAPTSAGNAPSTDVSDRPIAESQSAFFDRLRPLIEQENRRITELRALLVDALGVVERGQSLSSTLQRRVGEAARHYRVDGNPLEDDAARTELLHRVDTIPVSLALAQAANESAWGRSRFAVEGNNLFGIWTYDASKGLVPRQRAEGQTHLVRRFDSIDESVRYYLHNLNSHPAYTELRSLRAQMRDSGEPLDGLGLAAGLGPYSARGDDYIAAIRAMIRRFDLAGYDLRGPGKA